MSVWGLEGKTVVVTGGGRGIGRATVEALAAAGANVAFFSESGKDELEHLAQELATRFGVKTLSAATDVADAAQVDIFFRNVFSTFRRLDGLVNNAGVLANGLIGMISDEIIQRAIAVNITGALRCLQVGARLMQRTSSGSIVNLASIVGTHGAVGVAAYSATKAAMVGLTLSAAKELGPSGIRVNAIAPGYINTRMIHDLSPEIQASRLAGIPLGRAGEPKEVAESILFLLSPRAGYISGQVLGVDGAMVI